MHKYEGKSIRKVTTATGKLPAGVGFPRTTDGPIRKLTASERRVQRNLSK